MAAPLTYCTPYVSRTIKGWKIRVRLCWTAENTFVTATNLETQATLWPALLNALTGSTWRALGAQPVTEDVYGAGTGLFDNAEDRAVFTFATLSGSLVKVSVPNPLDSIFLADNMTVDITNAAVAAFVAAFNLGGAITAGYVGSTSTGSILNTYLGGLRVRGRTRRKMNIWVRNPELTAPGI